MSHGRASAVRELVVTTETVSILTKMTGVQYLFAIYDDSVSREREFLALLDLCGEEQRCHAAAFRYKLKEIIRRHHGAKELRQLIGREDDSETLESAHQKLGVAFLPGKDPFVKA